MRPYRHFRRRGLFAALFASAALAACGGKDLPAADTLRTTGAASPSADATTGLRVRSAPGSDTVLIEGVWSDAAERSNWTAAAIRGFIVRIEERAPVGGDDSFTRHFAFDSTGQLVHADDVRSQMVANPSASPSLMHVESTIAFRAGEVVRANKTVDGVPEPVQQWDIENVQRHAAALLALARPGIPSAGAPAAGTSRP